MDYLIEDSREEKLIEDYLFSGYRPAGVRKSAFELDQQFAKPIQDEDIFGFDGLNDNLDDAVDGSGKPFGSQCEDQLPFETLDDNEPDILCIKDAKIPGHIFEEESMLIEECSPEKQPHDPPSHIDDVFLDDYSDSESYGANNENVRPQPDKTYQGPKQPLPPPPPSPAQIKMKRMKEIFLEQARDMALKGLMPIKPRVGSNFGEDGTIEVQIEQSRMVSDSNSKFIFNKLFNNSKKANEHGTPECDKSSIKGHLDSLRRQICAKKRKIWDSFQQPVDQFDDEEEIIEPKADDEEGYGIDDLEKEELKDSDDDEGGVDDDVQNNVDDEDDGGFDDLDREEIDEEEAVDDIESEADGDRERSEGEEVNDKSNSEPDDNQNANIDAEMDNGDDSDMQDDDDESVEDEFGDQYDDDEEEHTNDGNHKEVRNLLDLEAESKDDEPPARTETKRKRIIYDDDSD